MYRLDNISDSREIFAFCENISNIVYILAYAHCRGVPRSVCRGGGASMGENGRGWREGGRGLAKGEETEGGCVVLYDV